MADNTTLSSGSGGDTIATDDIGGVKYQRVKISTGADGSATDVDVGGGVEAAALRVTVASDSTGVLSVDDNGSSLTVDGTVAATQSGTWTVQPGNTANTTAWKVDGSAVTQPVSNAALSVTGGGVEASALRVTLASDSTGVVSVDDNGGALTVDNGGTFAVQVSSALPAGTNAIGKLAANSGVDIGDVDVTSVTPGTGASSLGKAEDAAHTTGDVGVMALGVRVDSAAALAGTDGDYSPFQVDANGALRVTGGGGGTEYTVDAVAPASPTGSTFVMERDDALSALTEVEGDWTNPRANANGALWVKHDGSMTVDGSGVTQPVSGTVTVQDGGGAITVDNAGTFAVQADTELTTADLDTGAGTDTRAVVGLALAASGGAVLAGAANPVPISDNSGSLTVDNGGTFAVQAAQSGTWTVQPGNTANTTAWKVDASSVAVPVTDNSGSLTVDNGGTFAVQDSQVVADNAGFTDGTTKVFMGGYIYDEVAGTALTENDAAAARINVNRSQIGIIEDGTTRGRYATVSASNALKVDGSAVTQPVSYATTGSGTATGALRVELPTNGTGVVGLNAGTNVIGKVQLNPATTGGSTLSSTISAASTNATNVKGSAGVVYSIDLSNANASARWFKMYNKATSPTVGTDTPVFRAMIPAGGGRTISFPHGLTFGTGIGFALTTGAADSDTGAVAANELTVNLGYA